MLERCKLLTDEMSEFCEVFLRKWSRSNFFILVDLVYKSVKLSLRCIWVVDYDVNESIDNGEIEA